MTRAALQPTCLRNATCGRWVVMSATQRAPKAARSLLMFVQALEGLALIVELRNDTVVRGRVESVDSEMKCVAPEHRRTA